MDRAGIYLGPGGPTHQLANNMADGLLMFLVLDFAETMREFHQQPLTLANWTPYAAEPLEKVGNGRLQCLREHIQQPSANAIVASFVLVNLLVVTPIISASWRPDRPTKRRRSRIRPPMLASTVVGILDAIVPTAVCRPSFATYSRS
jgi:hypothetical protein